MFRTIKGKLTAFFFLLSLLAIVLVNIGVTRINQVTDHSTLAMAERVPLSRCAQEALLALTTGVGFLDKALALQNPEEAMEIEKLENRFMDSALTFEIFILAMIWGSESEAFLKSSNGEILKEWKNRSFDKNLIVVKAPHEIQQSAGKAHIYYKAFSKYAREIFALQKEAAGLRPFDRGPKSAQTKKKIEENFKKAERFQFLVEDTLEDVVTHIHQHVGETTLSIQKTRDAAIYGLIVSSAAILGLAFLIGVFFVRTVTRPLQALKDSALKISKGHLEARVEIQSKDEIGLLAESFNRMAEDVQSVQERLENQVNARTIELSQVNEKLEQEIVERKQAEKDLRRMTEEVQKARDGLEDQVKIRTKELESFVYTVSHDLRSPVTSLHGMASIFLEEYGAQIEQEGRKYIERITANVIMLENIIEGLLVLSRVGRKDGCSEKSNVRTVIEEVLDCHKEQLEKNKIEVAIDPALPSFDFNRVKLTQLFQNLITNSAKFMGNQLHPRIEIGGKEEKDWIEIFVKDNGIGIEPAYHDKIFGVFQRLNDIDVPGTGIGLSIVEKIVTLEGGRTWVDSNKGEGSVFFIRLPKFSFSRDSLVAGETTH